jgi:hypothetical protein
MFYPLSSWVTFEFRVFFWVYSFVAGLQLYLSLAKTFSPGGTAESQWTGSVRAVRDTPVADYSIPWVNTMCRTAYRRPIAVLPILLALSVVNEHSGVVDPGDHTSECVQWVHSCIGIAMGDAVKFSPHLSSTLSSRSVGRR